ncbi:coiled-coil domain-containing protein 71-like [Megalops cyprinoides]|uniref:coiled-coil domain-containing protein 71-like n=1 Tax=Megalops cyprinoides TaxID=118141 RepID=UPI0018644EA6|nr:coiled-coil domain-containing protein 71-like [Megalops cyprinoides]
MLPYAMSRDGEVAEKAVRSWCRIASAGQSALVEALRVFSPMSTDLVESETQLVSFLQGLRDEGHRPTVLKSKDVYGYKSCNSEPLCADKVAKPPEPSSRASKVQKPARRRGRKPTARKKEMNCTLSRAAAKIILKRQPRILLTNLSRESLQRTVLSKPPALTVRPAQMPPCLKLTNITGPSHGPTARLQIHTNLTGPTRGPIAGLHIPPGLGHKGIAVSSSLRPPALSGIPVQPSEKFSKMRKVSALKKTAVSCPGKVGVAIVRGPPPVVQENGRILKESNNYKMVPMRMGKASRAKIAWRKKTAVRTRKRKRLDEPEDKMLRKRARKGVWVVKGQEDSRLNENNLRFKVIKVDGSFTDEEVRRKAQKILRVNLSPVIEIRPLSAYPV